ncbi:unnamed protein product [Rotaria sordida]|uniref:Phospholipid scramblase n=1 Tax=Rotaria sordida TaxID=392033 RepID=A0A819PA33_9BILA|nr:unnamed protein product [Rotaria sordida]CAF4010998.1 unnamed protein product [Rotaria sordida]
MERNNEAYIAHNVPLFSSTTFNNANSGIEYLKTIDSLVVKHMFSCMEAWTGIAMQAKYGIFNEKGEQIFLALEESSCCQRVWCTNTRAFVLHIFDNNNQELIQIRREFTCCSGCCWCGSCPSCMQEVVVESPPGNVIGIIKQEGSSWRMNYVIKDAREQPILTIIGPCCICDGPYSCCCENKFTLFGSDRTTEIGAIYKKYSGFCKEAFTSSDVFSMHVPINMDVKAKMLVLGALFLIDFMNFSLTPQQQS